MKKNLSLDIVDLLNEDKALLRVALAALGNNAINENGNDMCALIGRIEQDLESITTMLKTEHGIDTHLFQQ